MTYPPINERRHPLHLIETAHRKATWWLAAIVGLLALLLAPPAVSHAEESNPNNYSCLGNIAAGEPEPGNEEQQVSYKFYCDGPITGYQLESQIPITGLASQPAVTKNSTGGPLNNTFSCSGEAPGFALNCVGGTSEGYDTVTGQFSIGTTLCKEPRVDPLLTVTYAYLEKGVITQAISGPFDLGRPTGCKPDAETGKGGRLNAYQGSESAMKHKHRKGKAGAGDKRKGKSTGASKH